MRWDVEGLKPSVGGPPAARAADKDERTCKTKAVGAAAKTAEAKTVRSGRKISTSSVSKKFCLYIKWPSAGAVGRNETKHTFVLRYLVQNISAAEKKTIVEAAFAILYRYATSWYHSGRQRARDEEKTCYYHRYKNKSTRVPKQHNEYQWYVYIYYENNNRVPTHDS